MTTATPDSDHADDDHLVTVEAAARIAGVHPATIRRWTAAGVLPTARTAGGHRRIKVGDVRAVGASRTKAS